MCITFTKPSSFGLCTRLHRCSSILLISSKQLRRSVEFRYGSKTAFTRTRRRRRRTMVARTTMPTTIVIRTTRIAGRRVQPTNDVITTTVIAIIFKEIGSTRVPEFRFDSSGFSKENIFSPIVIIPFETHLLSADAIKIVFE